MWDKRLRAAVGRLGNKLQVEYLSGLPTAEVLRRVRALSQGTIVFTPGYFVDGAGEVSTPRQSVERIAKASAVPVYGTVDTLLGSGIVGGYMTPYKDQAAKVGAMVVGLLKGMSLAEGASSFVARTLMIDWRQVRRWGIDERRLPANAIVAFREPTIWDKYWREISFGLAVLLLQTGLIVALLLERQSRHRAAIALEDSQKRMNLAARAAKLSVWNWDATPNRIRAAARSWLHDGAADDHGIALERVIESVYPADRATLEQAVERTLATGEDFDVEYRTVAADGRVRWIAARGRAQTGNSQRLYGVALDVTQRKLAELRSAQEHAALRHTTRISMMGQLSATIAHQLNQPLAAILGNAEVAQKMLGSAEVDLKELREICSDIVRDDYRATEVMRRLNALYRRREMKMGPVDLNELTRGTLDLLRNEFMIRYVAPVTDLAAEIPMIDGDHMQLQQVVLNLVLNAADAMTGVNGAERRLTIRTESSDTNVRLYVVDNGPGIPVEQLKTVFDAFSSAKPESLSMGLAISKSIVALHRGSITAANNREGGATFCVSFPHGQRASP